MRPLALSLLAACGAADPAADAVWALYGAPGEPPAIVWHAGRCLPESPPTPSGTCWAGRYELYGAARVATEGQPPSETALAHELMHARQWLAERAEDPRHERPDWAEVERANIELRKRGL